MEFLVENRNIIILIMIVIIGYLLYNNESVQNLMQHIQLQWITMNNLNKIIVILIILALAYRLWCYE